MNQLRRKDPRGYEDLMQELEAIEQSLRAQDLNGPAMELMVLETRIRERFQALTSGGPLGQVSLFLDDDFLKADDLTIDDLQALIPKELPAFPMAPTAPKLERKKNKFETIGMAAVLAVATALGVFGLATFVQVAISWIV